MKRPWGWWPFLVIDALLLVLLPALSPMPQAEPLRFVLFAAPAFVALVALARRRTWGAPLLLWTVTAKYLLAPIALFRLLQASAITWREAAYPLLHALAFIAIHWVYLRSATVRAYLRQRA